MAGIADADLSASQSPYRWHDVRFIGAIAGCYALPERRPSPEEKIPVYAGRLCSISTRMMVVVGPVVGNEDETILAHFDEFGILRGRIVRRLPSGFVVSLALTEADRNKLGARIAWQKKHVHAQVPDKRQHRRIIPRDPRSTITLADGARIPCFVIDISRSGVAVSAPIWPDIGTPMAVGRAVGRVIRYLDVGFALQFVHIQPLDDLERLLLPPVE